MPTYQEIGNAFGRCCDASWQLRDAAFAAGINIMQRVARRGQFPEGVFKPHPPETESLNFQTNYSVPGAMQYNTQTNQWNLGTFLEIRRGNDEWPREYLRLTFMIRQSPTECTASLVGSDVSVTFAPRDNPETLTALDAFADQVLEALFDHYETLRDKWMEEGNQQREIGFHSVR